jgi:hypothetical protein
VSPTDELANAELPDSDCGHMTKEQLDKLIAALTALPRDEKQDADIPEPFV